VSGAYSAIGGGGGKLVASFLDFIPLSGGQAAACTAIGPNPRDNRDERVPRRRRIRSRVTLEG
jgi:hypothetical protein